MSSQGPKHKITHDNMKILKLAHFPSASPAPKTDVVAHQFHIQSIVWKQPS